MDAQHYCEDCTFFFYNPSLHRCSQEGQRGGHDPRLNKVTLGFFNEHTRTHRGVIVSYRHTPDNLLDFDATVEENQQIDILAKFFEYVEEPFIKLIKELMVIFKNARVKIVVNLILMKEENFEDGPRILEMPFNPPSQFGLNLNPSDIRKSYFIAVQEITDYLGGFNERGSGWTIKSIESLDVIVGKYNYFSKKARGYLPMPIKNRKGFINPRNQDDNCFQYCIVMSRHHCKFEKNKDRPSQYDQFFHEFDFSDIKGPLDVTSNSLQLFEDKNDIGVTVYSSQEDGEIIPVRRPEKLYSTQVDLYLIVKDDQSHLVYIRDLKKFMCNGRKMSTHICSKCSQSFWSKAVLQKHVTTCKNQKTKQIFLKDQHIKFNKPCMTLPYPYLIFFDFESYLVPIEQEYSSAKKSKTNKLQSHKPASYSLCIVENTTAEKSKVITIEYFNGENGENIVEHFFKSVFKHAHTLLKKIRSTNNFSLPDIQTRRQHFAKTNCEYCGKKFKYDVPADRRTFHHNHFQSHYISTSKFVYLNLYIKIL